MNGPPDAMPTWARNTDNPKLRSVRFAESGIVQVKGPVRPSLPSTSAASSDPPEIPILNEPITGNGTAMLPSSAPSTMPVPRAT